jgi:peptide/nickel transport system permease protein
MVIKKTALKAPHQNMSGLIDELKRLPWPAIIILFLLLFVIAFAGILTHHDPYTIDLPHRLQPPAWMAGGDSSHLLGTDTLGRDVLTRILYGARASMLVGVVTMILGGSIGLVLGMVAGYLGGKIDAIISRITDSFMALPALLIAIVFAVNLQPGIVSVIFAISATIWAQFARIIRGESMALKEREFILQAKVGGCSTLRILFVNILPNVLNTFMIMITLNIGMAILVEASLSFLGVGIPPPTPSWGQMISEGRDYISTAYWLALFPGIVIALTVLALQMFGDWLRDKLDPKLRQF